jgi:hypothetical protein
MLHSPLCSAIISPISMVRPSPQTFIDEATTHSVRVTISPH